MAEGAGEHIDMLPTKYLDHRFDELQPGDQRMIMKIEPYPVSS